MFSIEVLENLQQMQTFKAIKHPNIVKLHLSLDSESTVLLIMEYCNVGDLGDYVSKKGPLRVDVLRQFSRQIVAGLQALRNNSIVHRLLITNI